ncbi:MAG: hypothetical protein JW839_01000, partial [Candidatus Lokiarchaeota archaeon]|nr:hypothetical protein [Candidatus Lokiarchaeota archaeon]
GIWLGIEYIKLAGRFEAAGTEVKGASSSRTATLFKVLAALAFCSAAMYVLNMAVFSPMTMGPLMEIADDPSDPASLAGLFSILNAMIVLVVVSMGITMAAARVARAAWEGVLANLAGEPAPTTPSSGSYQVARVVKGANQAFQAGIMLAIAMALFGVMISMMFYMFSGGPTSPVLLIVLALPAAFLGIAGLVSSLAGMVNQAVGLFDLGKNMGLDPLIGGMMLATGAPGGGVDGGGGGGTSRAGRLCLKCLQRLPDDPNVKFCPMCGAPI